MRQSFCFWNPILTFFIFLLLPLVATAVQENALNLSPAEKQWLEKNKEIVVAFDAYFPPYSFENKNEQLEGFSVDVLTLLSEITGIHFQIYESREWNDIYQAAKNHEVDVVATMVNRPDRQQWFHFTSPYIYKSLVVITRDDEEDIGHREHIDGRTIALVRGYQYVEPILEAYPSIQPQYHDSMIDALHAVALKDADATISFLSAGHYYRNKFLLSNLKYSAVFDKNTANESIAVRKDWPELRSILDKALRAIPEHKLQALRTRWLPVDYMESLVDIPLTETEKEWIKQHKEIRLGIDPEFAPFEYLEGDRYLGMASDYVEVLNDRLGLNMKVVKDLSWEDVTARAQTRDIDVLPAVGLTEERQQYLNFTQPYLNFHRVIITRSDAPFISGLRDIEHQKIAVQLNSSHHGYIAENSTISPVLYGTLQESLMAVSGGEVDAFIGNVASSTYWIRKLHLTNLKVAAPVSREVQNLHFAVRKDWPELASILQKGLNTITPRHQKQISDKWLTLQFDSPRDYTLAWQLGLALGLLLIGVILWNVLLNRKVQLRTSQLEYTANYDQLTGLPNRILTLDRLKQSLLEARQSNEKVALLSIDLDDFKAINDAYSHQVGDSLLKAFSARLQPLVQANDSIGRLGGDQFLIILNHFREISDAAILAEKIIKSFQDGVTLGEKSVTVTASLGIAIYPNDGDNASSLLKHADSATHYAKENIRGTYAFYTENHIEKVSRRLKLDQMMRGAIERGEFAVHYQPKVNARSAEITGFEALLRWFNDDLGAVSPTEFIPIAEKNGLIEELGQFVLNTALKQLKRWHEQFDDQLTMAVNLSPVQFSADDVIQQIESAILNADVQYKQLEFEITEGVLLANYAEIPTKLRELEAMGVKLAMDDFGTGYSSLSYLRKYKFDILKIDREFVTDVAEDGSDRKLIAAIIAMAHGLGINVVAEGVETIEQRDTLIQLNCDSHQGWLYGKAVPVSDIERILRTQNR